ncbi:MAG: DUF4143 domain-containing protein [Haliscomenobacteraceae bacterium CHB4]|nr:DUF4143 domain-containing protein [Haliscomenobacteraceae bacterium CHB4]
MTGIGSAPGEQAGYGTDGHAAYRQNNPAQTIVKARKLYFLDNGIASLSAELSGGSKFENAVFNQLRHYGDVSCYSLKTGNEIDFVLNKKAAFEVKESALESHLKNTVQLAKNLGIDQCYVVGRYPVIPYRNNTACH